MIYKLVSDKLLKDLQQQIACLRCEPTAKSYTPTSSSDATGIVGEVTYDQNFLYVKISSTVWKRITLNSF